jgi:neutral ceramidase
MLRRVRPIILLVQILAFTIAGTAQIAVADDAQWNAGVARVNISPELPIWLSGYGGRDHPAAAKHDDLWTKALVIEDADGHRAVLCTVDLAGIPRDLSTLVCKPIEKEFNLPRSAIALCASHTHSGPVVRGNLMAMYSLNDDQMRRVTEYKATLAKKMIRVIEDAFKQVKPAKLSWGIGEAGFAVNRRNNVEGKVRQLIKDDALVGPVDHDLPALAVHDEDGKLMAVVGGYACHATVLDWYLVSGDWPGAGQNELERRHPGTIAMFVAGCGGDQNPLPRRSVDLMNKYGNEFADGVDSALGRLRPLSPKLKTKYEEIDLDFATVPTRAELELTTKEKKPRGTWAEYLLSQWDRDGRLPESYPYPVAVWQLGNKDLTWVLLGGEVVVDYSLRLKAELGEKNTWVSSYTNDVMAYIPSRRVLREGGYEGGDARYPYGLPAPWDGTIEVKIIGEVHKLVDALNDKGKN